MKRPKKLSENIIDERIESLIDRHAGIEWEKHTDRCDRALMRVLLRHLATGQTRRDASQLAGVTRKTLYEWMANGPEWLEAAVDEAESIFRQGMVNIIVSAAKDPNLALAVLARRDHEHWGPREKVDMTAKVETIDSALATLAKEHPAS